MMWSPLLGVQKPWQLVQGKLFQEGLLLGPLVGAVAAQHDGVALVLCRSVHASCASQRGGGGGWRCRMEGNSSTVGSGGAAGASTVGSVVEEPGAECPPDPLLQGGGREDSQPCDNAPPLTHGCVGGVQVGPGGQWGGNPDCPPGLTADCT